MRFKLLFALLFLVSAASAYQCYLGAGMGAKAWWPADTTTTFGTVAQDICEGRNGTINAATNESSGMWNQAYGITAVAQRVDWTTASCNTLLPFNSNWTINMWVRPNGTTATQGPYCYAASQLVGWSRNVSNGWDIVVRGSDGVGPTVRTTRPLTNSSWTMLTASFNDNTNNVTIWVNGVYNNSATGAILSEAAAYSTAYLYGFAGSTALGRVDEISIFNYSMHDNYTQITNLYAGTNVSGITPPAVDNVASNGPATGTYNYTSPMRFSYTPTTYYVNWTGCTLWNNATAIATNATNIVNASVNYIDWTGPPLGNHSWFVSCNNGSQLINSTARTFLFDNVSATATVNAPTTTGTYHFGSAITLNRTYADNYALAMCNYTVYAANGTRVASAEASCTGTSLTNTSSTYTPDWVGVGSVNLTVSDQAGNTNGTNSTLFTVLPIATSISTGDLDTPLAARYMNKTVWANYGTGNATGFTLTSAQNMTSVDNCGTDRCGIHGWDGTYYYGYLYSGAGADFLVRYYSNGTKALTCTSPLASLAPIPTYWNGTHLFWMDALTGDVYAYGFNSTTCVGGPGKIANGGYVGGYGGAASVWQYGGNIYWQNVTHVRIYTNITAYTEVPLSIAGLYYSRGDADSYTFGLSAGNLTMRTGTGFGTILASLSYNTSIDDGLFVSNSVLVTSDFPTGANKINVARWTIAPTGAITGATCNATLDNTTSLPMTWAAGTSTYNVTYDEPSADGSLANATISCGKSGYSTAASALQYGVDYWQTPRDAETLSDYTGIALNYRDNDSDSFEAGNGTLKCVRVQPSGNSMSTGGYVTFAAYWNGAATGPVNMSFYAAVADFPDYPLYATCGLTKPTSQGWAVCTTTMLQDILMGDGSSYFVCANRSSGGLGHGSFASTKQSAVNTIATWGYYAQEMAESIVFGNTFNTTVGTPTGCLYGYTLEKNTLTAVPGAIVQGEYGGTTLSATSGATGFYQLCNLPAITPVYVTATATNYKGWSLAQVKPVPGYISLESNESYGLNITLEPNVMGGWANLHFVDQNGKTQELRSADKRTAAFPMDTTIRTMTIEAYDNKDDPLSSGLDADVTTNCTYSAAPTDYRLMNVGGAIWQVQGKFAGTWANILNANCADTEQFVVRVYGSAMDITFTANFEGKKMEIRSAYALVDALPAWGWIQIGGLAYDASGLNSIVEPTDCNVTVYYPMGTNLTATTPANLTGYNITMMSATAGAATDVYARFECQADGYDDLDTYVHLDVADDWMSWACGIYDSVGNELEYHATGQQVEHRCAFWSTAGTCLAGLLPTVKKIGGDGWSGDIVLQYKPSMSSGSTYIFSRSFADNSPPAAYRRTVELGGIPAGVTTPDPGSIFYYDKITGSANPPKVVSIDAPELLDKGETYTCTAVVNYGGPFSRQSFWLTAAGNTYPVAAVDSAQGEVHTFTVTVPNAGSTGALPLNTTSQRIACYGQLEYECPDCDSFTGKVPLGPAYTEYSGNVAWDFFGIFGFIKGMMTSPASADAMLTGNAVQGPGNFLQDVVGGLFKDPITTLLTLCVMVMLVIAIMAVSGKLRRR